MSGGGSRAGSPEPTARKAKDELLDAELPLGEFWPPSGVFPGDEDAADDFELPELFLLLGFWLGRGTSGRHSSP